MRRRILIVASWFPSAASPLNGIFVLEQARILARSYDVAVLVPRLVGWRDLGRPGPRSERELDGQLLVRRERAIAPAPGALALAFRAYLGAARRGLAALVEEWGMPDLIHAHVVLPGGWAARALGAERGVPVVLTEHSSPFTMHLGTAYRRALVRETLGAAAATLAVSPALAAQIQAFYPAAVVQVVGNVIRTEHFTPGEAEGRGEGPLRLLVVGLLSKQKGIDYLLEAAQLLLRRAVPRFELVIGGDGAERGRLERRARQLGLGEHCRFVGLLDRAATRGWMRWCDLFVLPSLHETFGIVVGEAMACGKPVVATRCGGPEYLVTPESGLLVEPGDAEALAGAIAAWAERREAYDGEAIRRGVVKRFGEDAFLAGIGGVYERVWAGRAATGPGER